MTAPVLKFCLLAAGLALAIDFGAALAIRGGWAPYFPAFLFAFPASAGLAAVVTRNATAGPRWAWPLAAVLTFAILVPAAAYAEVLAWPPNDYLSCVFVMALWGGVLAPASAAMTSTIRNIG